VTDGTWCDNPRIKTDSYRVRVVDDQIQVAIEQDDS
jgi:nitrite reductase (NADH) small subunit